MVLVVVTLGVLVAELLQNYLLRHGPGHAEPEKLLENKRLVFCCAHLPFHQVAPTRILEYVTPLIILNGPSKSSEHRRDLLWVEQREEAIQQHL